MTTTNLPRSAKTKIAFTGTNSSGKTTMALEMTARLKRQQHVLAEVVSSQDRKITWKDEHFPVDPRAHYGMVSGLVKAEVEAELKGDADVVLTDRSVLDLYAIALTDHPNHSWVNSALWAYVQAWLQSYTRVYYLAPLDYQEDGKRPSDDFRMRTHATLRKLIETHKFPNVVEIPREDVFKDICGVLGIAPVKPIYAEAEKWQAVADHLGTNLRVKHSEWGSSDVDVWIYSDANPFLTKSNAVQTVEMYFGRQVKFDVMMVPTSAFAHEPVGNTTPYIARSN